MNSRLAASIYVHFAATCWRNTRSRISSPVTSLNRRHGQISCRFASFQARRFESSNVAVHSSGLDDDEFSELGPRISHSGARKKIQFVAEIPEESVHTSISEDADFSELGPRISECTADKLKLLTEKADDLVDDDFSNLGPRISECAAEKIKLATEKPDDIVDDDFSKLGSGISECSAKQINLVSEKHDDFVDDDDNFSKLSSGITECFSDQIKLVTQKSDRFLRNHVRKKEFRKRPLSSSDKRSILNGMLGITSETGPKHGGHEYDHATSITDDTRKISGVESPCSVSIKNIPSTIGLPELVEGVSVFGKVSGASFVNASSRLRCCNIDFEDMESSRRAVLSGKVIAGSQVFPVDPHDAVEIVTVRIKNISEMTSDYEIHSMCKSVGELVGLTRASKHSADAFFNVRNNPIHVGIVERLNNTIVDLRRWSAHVIGSKSQPSEVPSHEEVRYKLSMQIFNGISKQKKSADVRRIWLEDLEYLNASIMHIDARPRAM